MPRRKVLTVDKASAGWKVASGGSTLAEARTKAQAVRRGVQLAKEGQPSSLQIKGRDGRIQEERTYPRSSDPRKTKG
jgi:hypothetical protein